LMRTDPELIKQWRWLWNQADSDFVQEGYFGRAAKRILELVAQAPPHPQARWVPVSERLPEPDTLCIVMDSFGVTLDTWRMQREAPVSWSAQTIETGLGWDDHADMLDVTYWMPMPPLPSPPAASPDAAQDQPGAVE